MFLKLQAWSSLNYYPQGPPTLLTQSLLPAPAITSYHHQTQLLLAPLLSLSTLELPNPCALSSCWAAQTQILYGNSARRLLRSGTSISLLCTVRLQALYCLHLLLRMVFKCPECLTWVLWGFLVIIQQLTEEEPGGDSTRQCQPGLLRKKRPLWLIGRNEGCMWKKYYNLAQNYQVAFCLKILNIKYQLCTSNLFTIPS